MKLRFAAPHLAFHEVHDLLRFCYGILLRRGADNRILPSKRITEGVMRSLSEFGMICGFPYASMCAMALKVVPRSMPTALRFVTGGNEGFMDMQVLRKMRVVTESSSQCLS
jgi:hypothetical protein